ncbi:MAG: RNA methyltransferase [Gammaproteobacteria bacterium]
MVETSHPGNIGAAARAMKTMGLEHLSLVRPKQFPCAESTARASGADDILARARVHDSLGDALAGARFVIGTSARLRSLRWEQLDPRVAAGRLYVESASGEVAVVFGRERSGLSNEEMDLCHALLHIPTNPDYQSLNLAMAVQVVAYELRMRRDAGADATAPAGDADSESDEDRATFAEIEGFYGHLEQTMVKIGFLDPEAPRLFMRRMRRLFGRTRLYQDEIHILRGILSTMSRRIP